MNYYSLPILLYSGYFMEGLHKLPSAESIARGNKGQNLIQGQPISSKIVQMVFSVLGTASRDPVKGPNLLL